MLRKLSISLIIGLVLTVPSISWGQNTPQTSNLQTFIQQLQEQVKALQEQVTLLQAQLKTTREEVAEVKTELRITRSLQRGATGDEVKELQEFLKKFPDIYPEGLVTGYFGPLTEIAVKKLQERQGIEPIGIVGPKTLLKINELLTEGAGASGVIPPGLLIASGIQDKLATTTVITTSTIPITPTSTPRIVITTTTPTSTESIAPTLPLPTTYVPPPSAITPPSTTPLPSTTTTTTTTATTTTSSSADTTAPVISNVQAINITSDGALITWITNEVSDSRVDYSSSPTIPLDTESATKIDPGGPVFVTSHSLSLEHQLAPGTTYRYRVWSKDAAYNTAKSAEYTFTTLLAGPPVPTNIQAVTSASSQNQPPQMWYYMIFDYTLQSGTQSFNIYRKRPTDASFVKYIYSAQTPVNPSILPLPGSGESNLYHRDPNQWSWYTTLPVPAPASAAGEYQFYVTAVDTNGVESGPSTTKSLKIYAAPVIVSPADGSTVSSSFTITVTGDPSAPSYSTYGMALYKNTTGDTAWSAWPAPGTNFTYPGPALNPSDNPHRLVVWLSADGSSFSGTSIFNIATTSASTITKNNLATILSSLATIMQELQQLLR